MTAVRNEQPLLGVCQSRPRSPRCAPRAWVNTARAGRQHAHTNEQHNGTLFRHGRGLYTKGASWCKVEGGKVRKGREREKKKGHVIIQPMKRQKGLRALQRLAGGLTSDVRDL
ncbi:hypothetical protein PoB_006546600 [Plakobranchus ocellatus]|uniref:Uncharacterized protein n=1 Tax=Plakobranchus ocellatus TaxID=259542 RepID=A0AAV4D4C8_9GAST|nr:hypothetical protein PoB_006546600 [Plakobranchus ocellatus]